MERNVFLLLGGNKLNHGIYRKFKDHGYIVYVVDWNKSPHIKGDRHYQIDVKDYSAILDVLRADGVIDRLVLAYSSIDLAVRSVAMINREIGLYTISDAGLNVCCSKSLMTKTWHESGLLNRISKSYSEYSEEIGQFNKNGKIIIKPDNSASSRGITILDKGAAKEVLLNAFKKAQEEASNNLVVVEEFLEGTEFTVEMIGDRYGNVCVYGVSKKYHTLNTENNRIAVKLHYNAIPEGLQRKIAEYGSACYRALGFSASLGHLEIILKEDGSLSPVEIGARSSGYIAYPLVDVVSGADFIGDLLKIQKGEKSENGLHEQTEKSSMYFFYDFPKGSTMIKARSLLDYCIPQISSLYHDRMRLQKGVTFGFINSDNERIGLEILEGRREYLTEENVSNAEKAMMSESLVGNHESF